MGFWEWFTLIGGIIGGVALLMAATTFIDMIYRAPKIIIDFGKDDRQDTVFLVCKIWNKPITKGIPKWMHVSRNSARIVAFYRIEERGNGKLIFDTDYAVKIKTQAEVSLEEITLPPSILPASFHIIAVDKNDNHVYVHDGKGTDKQALPIGEYTAKIDLLIDGILPKKVQRDFIVKKDYPFARWKDL